MSSPGSLPEELNPLKCENRQFENFESRTPTDKSHAFEIGKSRCAMDRKLVVKLA